MAVQIEELRSMMAFFSTDRPGASVYARPARADATAGAAPRSSVRSSPRTFAPYPANDAVTVPDIDESKFDRF